MGSKAQTVLVCAYGIRGIKMDSIIDYMHLTDQKELAEFYVRNRRLLELNDRVVANRHTNGIAYRQFLMKCAYMHASLEMLRMDEFASMCGISVGKAKEFEKHLRSLRPDVLPLLKEQVKRERTETFSKKRQDQKLEGILQAFLKRKKTDPV